MREHPYFSELTHALTQAAFARGYHVVLLPSNYDETLEKHYLEQLRRKAYDGLIFTSHALPLTAMCPYQKYGPVVICHDPGAVDLPAAYADRGETYLEGYRWLKAKGAKRVGSFLPRAPRISATAAAMVAAYRTVFGGPPEPELLVNDVMANADGYQAAAKLAQAGVDGIFANGDDIAANAWRYYQDHGLSVPLIVGQEAQLSGQLLKIPTIDHHFQQVGELAVQLATGEATGQHAVPATFIAP
jgi:DNA-binding LacI/PurR family transcriptional regulator